MSGIETRKKVERNMYKTRMLTMNFSIFVDVQRVLKRCRKAIVLVHPLSSLFPSMFTVVHLFKSSYRGNYYILTRITKE